MRDVNNHDDYGYTDDMMEVMHDCELLCGTPVPDAFTAIVGEEGKSQMEKLIEETTRKMKEAAKQLDFLQAAQYRDEIVRLQKELELK